MIKFLVVAVFASTLMINLSQSFRLKIIGGRVSDIQEFPYQAALCFNGKLKCGASILSEWWALTAAHCLVGSTQNVTMRVGSTNKDSGGKVIEVVETIIHPNFDKPKLNNDFALMRLREPLQFDKTVRPIIITNEETIPEGTQCVVSGWGKAEDNTRPRELRFVMVSTVNSDTCRRNYNTTRVKHRITESMMCAGAVEGQKDACSGDSGGPLVCNGRLCGVVSSGFGCGLPDFPGVYARCFMARLWIRKVSGV